MRNILHAQSTHNFTLLSPYVFLHLHPPFNFKLRFIFTFTPAPPLVSFYLCSCFIITLPPPPFFSHYSLTFKIRPHLLLLLHINVDVPSKLLLHISCPTDLHSAQQVADVLGSGTMSSPGSEVCSWRPKPVDKDDELLSTPSLLKCNEITTAKSVHRLPTF